MRFKIKNELKEIDYKRLTEFLNDNPSVSFEVLPGVDLGFVSVNPTVITVEGFGYKMSTEILFKQSIGFEVYDSLKLSNELRSRLAVNRRNLQLSKIVMEPPDLEPDLNMIVKTIERIVNQVCNRFDKVVQQTIVLSAELLDSQLSMILEKEELVKRAEISRPFGTIHAKSSREAKARAGGLIPLYKERDKTYMYDAKRVYFLLPHDFVAHLLRCDDSTMVREEEFGTKGEEVLRDLVYKKRLKKYETLTGITCYYALDDKTRRYLVKFLGRKTSRF